MAFTLIHRLKKTTLLGIYLWTTGCTSLFYYPSSAQYYDKNNLPVQVDEGFFKDQKENQIHYWYLNTKNPKGKILFFHGNAQNLTAHFAMLAWVVDYNYDLMIFDYPGYGKSSGTPSPESTTLSGVAAMEKILTLKSELPLFLYGQSLGGQVLQKSINLKADLPYKAIFIEGSFLSYRSVAKRALSRHWLTWLFQPLGWLVMSDQWAGDPSLISPKPLYVIHGKQDGVVNYSEGEQIFAQAKDPKTFIPIENGGHGNTYFIEKGIYRKKLITILDSYL